VEDDPPLRMFAFEVVEEAGFVSLEAGNANEAASLLESRPDISVLFTEHRHARKQDGLNLPKQYATAGRP
jgi:hypothetical protein